MQTVTESSETDAAPKAYRVKGAAKALSVSERQIYRLIDDERLRAVKLDGITLIPAASLDALLECLPNLNAAKAA